MQGNFNYDAIPVTERVAGAATEHTKERFAGYKPALEALKLYGESQQGFTNFKANYLGMLNSNAHRANMVSKLVSPILSHIDEQKIMRATASSADRDLYAESIAIAEEDLAFITERLNMNMDLHAETYFGGAAKPFLQATLPHLYLDTIANNARYVVPFKNVDKPASVRRRKRKYISVNGVDYMFPDALRDPVVLAAVLESAQETFTVQVDIAAIAATGNKANIIELASNPLTCIAPVGGLVNLDTRNDKIIPVAYIAGIKLAGVAEIIPVAKAAQSQIHSQLRGRIAYTFTHEEKEHSIHGVLDFAKNTIALTTTADVEAITIRATIDGANMRNLISSFVRFEDHTMHVDKRIHIGLAYDKPSIAAVLALDNIDGVVETSAMIHEIAVATKDHYVFDTIDKTFEDLKASLIPTGMYTDNDIFEEEFVQHPNDPAASNYRPTDEISWREKMLPESISKLAQKIELKFQSKAGLTTVLYGHPTITRLIPRAHTVIEDGAEYAGVKSDAGIYSGLFNGKKARVVSTMRAKEDGSFMAVPRSTTENQETVAFYQWMSLMDNQGTMYRNPNAPHLPSITYIDLFTTDVMHSILGKINTK
ncbi:MAG: hypothetical protein ACRCZ9_08315 [Fusobacteriaceae bacterium]